MRRILALSVVVPLALSMAACATGGESSPEDEEVEIDRDAGQGGSDGGDHSDGGATTDSGSGGSDAFPDADAGEEPDDDAGDAGAGGEDPGDGDAGSDAATDPCAPAECFIADSCIEAGLPNPANSCQACLPTAKRMDWSQDANSAACDGKPYWEGVTQAIPVTPYGRKTAVSCHNCYVVGTSNADSLQKTLAMIHDGRGKVADLIELDIKEEGGTVYVEHDDTGGTKGARFGDVIADTGLKASSKILFIESKETTTSEAYVRQILEALKANGYAKPGRPVVLRAFDNVSANLALARKLLATAEFVSMRPYVRLHVLFSRGDGNDIANLQTRTLGVKEKGFHGVEFEYQTPNLFGALKYAESLDLGINVWTIPAGVGEVFVATLRDEVDAITVDYSVEKSREVIEHKNGLVYVNTWNQSGPAVKWFQQNAASSFSLALGASDRPQLVDSAVGKSLFGRTLAFDALKSQHAPLYDGDNDPNEGYLVSTVVTFDKPIPADGQTSVLIGKANSASFSLELYNPTGGGNADAVLRFGVYVGSKYEYATYPANKLQVGPSYIVTGAYDGDGSVWIWVNNSAADSTLTGSLKGGVKQNDSPIVMGADPEVGTDTRYYFAGKIQAAIVQRWANH